MPRPRKYYTDEERKAAKLASNRKSYHVNLERSRQQRREWARRNKDKLRPHWNLRDARKRACEGSYTADDVERIYAMQKGRCAICAQRLGSSFHRDHIMPLALGGSNWPSNIQLLCAPCNIGKGAKEPSTHMRDLGRLL